MAKVRVSFANEESRERVIKRCQRLGDMKVSGTSVTLEAKKSLINKVILYLSTHPEIISVIRLKKKR